MDDFQVGDNVVWTDDYDPTCQFVGWITEINEDEGWATVKCECGTEHPELYLDQLCLIKENNS